MSWYRVERGWEQHEVFGNAQFSERDAWIWMIGSAAWEDCEVRFKNHIIPLKRGQLTFALSFLSKKFGWSINRVQRVLKLFTKWNMIEVRTDTHQTIITICNYNRYQDRPEKTDTQPDTLSDMQSDTQPDNKNKNLRTKERKKEDKKEPQGLFDDIPAGVKPDEFFLPDWISPIDWKDFAEMRKKKRAVLTDRAAKGIIKKLENFRREGHDAGTILEQSIRNSWTDVYAPKAENGGQGGQYHNQKTSYLDKIKNAGNRASQIMQERLDADRDAPWNQVDDDQQGGHSGGVPGGILPPPKRD